MRRHPKNQKLGRIRIAPPKLTQQELKKAVKDAKSIAEQEWEDYEKRWYKSCEKTHVRD